jgi:hypothetical protein
VTLDEIFEKYPDAKKIYRRGPHPMSFSIEFCKGLKSWGNAEVRKLGFWIPKCMIDDANANDWEIEE